MYDVLLPGISGLSFDSSFFISSLSFFLPSPLTLSVLSFFCHSNFCQENSQTFFIMI